MHALEALVVADGGLTIEAPPEAAEALAAPFENPAGALRSHRHVPRSAKSAISASDDEV